MSERVETMERGNLYMAYRPTVDTHEPSSQADVQRFYLIMSPCDRDVYRMVVVGRKELPDPGRHGVERNWGYVEAVARDAADIRAALMEQSYDTKTRGTRTLPAARPAGEGVYRLVRHKNHTHLVYALELPSELGEVQKELGVAPEASYVITVKNPEASSPPQAGLDEERKASFPERLQRRFRGRRFSELDPPEFLDHEGAEILLVSASDDVKDDLGIELDPDDETETSADVFKDLRLDRDDTPTAPLFEGRWQ